MRSCDYGDTWECCGPDAFQTGGPWGWVDPATDRIFNVQMQGLETLGSVGAMMMVKPG